MSSPKAFSVLEKKIFKSFYYIWAWRPSWSTDRDHFSNFSFPHPKEAPYEIWAKLAQRLQRRSRLKMLTDGCTHGRTDARMDNGRKVITIAHPEQSSGELKILFWNLMLPWQPNKMAPGHQTHKLGRQSSEDHNCQIWFTSLQWLWRKCN